MITIGRLKDIAAVHAVNDTAFGGTTEADLDSIQHSPGARRILDNHVDLVAQLG